MEISCNFLWVEWSKNDPNSNEVIAAKQKISQYTKQDWQYMSTEAVEMVDYLKQLVVNKTDIDQPEAEKGFDLFVEHFFKWFFPISTKYTLRLSTVIKFDPQYTLFFDQFHQGLADYMNKLLQKYAYKVDAGYYA
jgi:hypothetical protein